MTVRLGILAAARIAVPAIVNPVREVEGVDLVAVAARDHDRAKTAADDWGAHRAHGSYDELIADPEVDAIYIGTPASLHRPWAVAALDAGKHVLCEKPLASNADDARLIAAAAERSETVAMEAYHWRYHPFAKQIADIMESGRLGRIDRIDAAFDIPAGRISPDNIRWTLPLGGGATMDLGCYPIQWVRHAAGADPDVVAARASRPEGADPAVDGALEASLRWPSGIEGRIHSSMTAPGDSVEAWLRVTGELGTMTATNPLAPQNGGAMIIVDLGDRIVSHPAEPTATYLHQLEAFRDAIVDGRRFPTTIRDGVRTMEIIDACYRAAGLEPRPSHVDGS